MHNSVKHLLLYLIIGGGFVATVTLVQAILFATVGLSLASSIRDLTSGVVSIFSTPMIFVTAFVDLAILGGLVYVWARLHRPIAMKLGISVAPAQKLMTKAKIALVLTFVAVGIVTYVTFLGFNEAIAGIGSDVQFDDVTSLYTTLLAGDLLGFGVAVIGYIILGIIVVFLGRLFTSAGHVAEKLTKDH